MSSRRDFIKSSIALSMLAVTPWSQKVLAALSDPEVIKNFPYGVASGDPTHSDIVLWTRIELQKKYAYGDSYAVQWQIAEDQDFKSIVNKGEVLTNQYCDFSVKVDVENLQSGRVYYYRFIYGNVISEVGRTRTLPKGRLDALTLAIASCSNYPFGYFNAYEVIATDEEIDFVLHLGDYIYEYGIDGYGSSTGIEIGRNHNPSHEIISLQDYRQRHAQYKADRSSRLMHAAHPLIAIWDDHESTNNPYMHGAQNHQQDIEGSWESRRNVSLQAYYEWMPVREPKRGFNRSQLWRSFEFGDLASMVTLETRHTGRELQIDYAEHIPAIIDDNDLMKFSEQVLWDSKRTMLSTEMQGFVSNCFSKMAHGKRWNLIANQIPMARTHVPDVANLLSSLNQGKDNPIADEQAQFKRLGELNLPLYTDTWDGYPVAREEFYNLAKQYGLSDLLVLTGDSHSFWFNELYDQNGNNMGYELGTAGITSPGDFESFGEDAAKEMDRLLTEHNREVLWTDGRHRGFVKLSITPDQSVARYLTISNILSERYEVSELKKVVIKQNQGELNSVPG